MAEDDHQQRILRFPRAEDDRKKGEPDFVLVQVLPSGIHALDLKLVGTNGFDAYVVKLRQNRVSTLKVADACSDAEWEDILTDIFTQNQQSGIETTAKVTSRTLTLSVRKAVEEYSKHLGDIALSQDTKEEIDVVDWCNTALVASEARKKELAREKARTAELDRAVAALTIQIDQLIEAKSRDEGDLLRKFRDLLNEKKVKIREQQRIIAAAPPAHGGGVKDSTGADADVGEEEVLQAQRPTKVGGPSRGAKRKAPPTVKDEPESSDVDVERMDVEPARELESESEGQQTPRTEEDDETASEDDSGEEAPAPAPKAPARRGARSQVTKSSAPSKSTRSRDTVAKGQGAMPPPPAGPSAASSSSQPPAKRDLPFATKSATARPKPAPKRAVAEASETDSDDEL